MTLHSLVTLAAATPAPPMSATTLAWCLFAAGLVGAWIGAALGYLLAASFAAAAREDERLEAAAAIRQAQRNVVALRAPGRLS